MEKANHGNANKSQVSKKQEIFLVDIVTLIVSVPLINTLRHEANVLQIQLADC
jgi:hypothetical protein